MFWCCRLYIVIISKPVDRFRYFLHHFNEKSIICTMLQKSQNFIKYPCNSFWEVGSYIYIYLYKFNLYIQCSRAYVWGDGVAQLVEHRTLIQRTKVRIPSGSNQVRSTRNICEFFRVKNVVLTRFRCAQPLCVHAHTRIITCAR